MRFDFPSAPSLLLLIQHASSLDTVATIHDPYNTAILSESTSFTDALLGSQQLEHYRADHSRPLRSWQPR